MNMINSDCRIVGPGPKQLLTSMYRWGSKLCLFAPSKNNNYLHHSKNIQMTDGLPVSGARCTPPHSATLHTPCLAGMLPQAILAAVPVHRDGPHAK